MTNDQFQQLIQLLTEQSRLLERMAIALEAHQPAPNHQANLTDFPTFNWARIGATVEKRDRDGAAVVSWHGHQYTRRSASNKFQPAIWFSRAIGKDDQGENRYERLITFKVQSEAEPLPEKVRRSHPASV